MLSKIKRPLVAMALVMGLGMGVASAYDACSPCVPVQPTAVTAVCPAPVQPAPMPVSNVCGSPCALPSSGMTAAAMPMASTQIAGYPVTPTSATMSVPSNGITYIIPSMHGTLESSTLPVGENEVDRWYATHRVVGNQVVMY